MNLENGKENFFFEDLNSLEVFQKKAIEEKSQFINLISYRLHKQSANLSEFQKEIENNLLLLSNKDSRIAYLKRIINKAEYLKERFLDNCDVTSNGVFPIALETPFGTIPQVYSVPSKWITNYYKSGLAYLFILIDTLRYHLEVDQGQEQSKDLEVLFPGMKLPARILLCDRLGILDSISEKIGITKTSEKFYKLLSYILGIEKYTALEKYVRISEYPVGKEPTSTHNHRKSEHYRSIIKILGTDIKMDNNIINRLVDEMEIIDRKYIK